MEQIDLSSGASYFKSPDTAIEAAITALKAGKTTYGPTEGILPLRDAIGAGYRKSPITLQSENILITPGTKQALYNLFTTLLTEKDEVIIPTPAWFGFHGLLKYSQSKAILLETSLADDYTISIEALKKVLSEKSRILLLTNPGNPTGRLFSKKELETILEVTADYPNLYLLVDEIYDLDTYGKPFTSILSCKGAALDRTIVVNGFSKTFAMSGWRIGYMAGPAALIQKCADFQGSTLSGVSVFIQEAALATLHHKAEALDPMLEVLHANRDFMQQVLSEIPEVKFYLPEGAYYFFPDFSYYLGSTTISGKTIDSSIALCNYLQQEYNLILAPGDHFGARAHARMSFAVEKTKLEEGMARLKKGLLSLQL